MTDAKPDPRPFKRTGTPKVHPVGAAYEEGADVTSTVMSHLYAVTGVPRATRPKVPVHLTPAAQVDVFDAALRIVRTTFVGDPADLARVLIAEVVPHTRSSDSHGLHARVWRGVLVLGELAVECVVAEKRPAAEKRLAAGTGWPATRVHGMRLLGVASALEVQHHPLRSLIGLFMRVLDRERLERVKERGEEAYGHLLNVYSSTLDESTENECRRRLHAFADAVGTPDNFFDLLDAGQLQLAHVIARHVVGDRSQPLDPTLHYASCGLSYASDYASQPGEPPVGELAIHVPEPSLEEHERRLRTWEADLKAAVAEKDEKRRLELAHAEREISLLDRPGWSKTPAQQAALERMRGRRAELLAPPKEAPPRPTPDLRETLPEWTEDLRKLAETNPVEAADVVLTWERRVAALGGGKGGGSTIIGRGVHAREEYRRLLAGIPDRRRLLENTVDAAAAVSTELDRLSPCLAVADRLFPGAVGRELLGDIEGLYGELLGRLREACSRAREEDPAKPERASYPSTAPEGAPPRGVRYLSEDERQFLVRTSRPGATYWRDSELLTRMRDAGLVKRADDAVEDEGRWQTTAAGATAVETWRYQVPAG